MPPEAAGELTAVFSTFYFLGCLFAVVAASNKALFTAMAQPPLLLFAAVPIGHTLIGKDNSTALRDIAINIAYPLVNRFPIMLAATVVVLIIGGFRYFLLNQRPTGPARSTRSRRSAATTRDSSAAATRETTRTRDRASTQSLGRARPGPPRRRAPEVDEQPAYRSTPRREPIQDERPAAASEKPSATQGRSHAPTAYASPPTRQSARGRRRLPVVRSPPGARAHFRRPDVRSGWSPSSLG